MGVFNLVLIPLTAACVCFDHHLATTSHSTIAMLDTQLVAICRRCSIQRVEHQVVILCIWRLLDRGKLISSFMLHLNSKKSSFLLLLHIFLVLSMIIHFISYCFPKVTPSCCYLWWLIKIRRMDRIARYLKAFHHNHWVIESCARGTLCKLIWSLYCGSGRHSSRCCCLHLLSNRSPKRLWWLSSVWDWISFVNPSLKFLHYRVIDVVSLWHTLLIEPLGI